MRQNLLRALLALGLLVASTFAASNKKPTADPNAPPKTNQAVQVTLKQQLQKGLKLRRPIEFEFVDGIVQMVDEDKLPINTVNKAFAWSRQRNKFRPYVYFEASLIELAKRDGVDIQQELVDQKNKAEEAAKENQRKAEKATSIIERVRQLF